MPQATATLSRDFVYTGSTVSLILTGTNAHFNAESLITFPENSGLAVTSLSVEQGFTANEMYIYFDLHVSESATIGNVIGTVSSPFGQGYEELYFPLEVVEAPSMLVTPASGYQGDTIYGSVVGFGTHFMGDVPATLLLIEPASQGVTIDLTYFQDSQNLSSAIYISPDAVPGDYTVTATTTMEPEDEVVSATFTVLEAQDTDTVDTDTVDTDSDTGLDTDTSGTWVSQPTRSVL